MGLFSERKSFLQNNPHLFFIYVCSKKTSLKPKGFISCSCFRHWKYVRKQLLNMLRFFEYLSIWSLGGAPTYAVPSLVLSFIGSILNFYRKATFISTNYPPERFFQPNILVTSYHPIKLFPYHSGISFPRNQYFPVVLVPQRIQQVNSSKVISGVHSPFQGAA